LLGIDTAFADDLFEKLLFKEVNGEKIECRTNHATKNRARCMELGRARPLPA
jgi:hypothetical protein